MLKLTLRTSQSLGSGRVYNAGVSPPPPSARGGTTHVVDALQADGHDVGAPGGAGAAGAGAGADPLAVQRDSHVELALEAGDAGLHPGREVEADLQRLVNRRRPVAGETRW